MIDKLQKPVYLYTAFRIVLPGDIMKAIRDILEDELFYTGEVLQSRYEMIRAWRMYDITQEEAAQMFGYSLSNFKRLWKRYREDGALGLLDRNPGPRSRRNSTERARQRIVQLREEDMNIYEIADIITQEGVPISYGTVNRVLREEGYLKKTRSSEKT